MKSKKEIGKNAKAGVKAKYRDEEETDHDHNRRKESRKRTTNLLTVIKETLGP